MAHLLARKGTDEWPRVLAGVRRRGEVSPDSSLNRARPLKRFGSADLCPGRSPRLDVGNCPVRNPSTGRDVPELAFVALGVRDDAVLVTEVHDRPGRGVPCGPGGE